MKRKEKAKKVIIIGAGFGGLSAARVLKKSQLSVTLIDKNNYHVFQPLLYQVATNFLSESDIITPIRSLFRGYKNISVVCEELRKIDLHKKCLQLSTHSLTYDYLILAPGAQANYFGHHAWSQVAPCLKGLKDAVDIRTRILQALESSACVDHAEQSISDLTFVVIGGGATGVEIAGALADLVQAISHEEFPSLSKEKVRIILLEGASAVLAGFAPELQEYTCAALKRKGVEVRLNTPVQEITDHRVILAAEVIKASGIFWCAGVEAVPVAQWLGLPAERGGRVRVEPDLSLPGYEDVFVIGDAAFVLSEDGHPLPGLASVAKQQGAFVARKICARAQGKKEEKSFRYKNLGMLATIGKYNALAQWRWMKCRGFFAWILWGLVHLYYLISVRNRLRVFLGWIWGYLLNRPQLGTLSVPNKDKSSQAKDPMLTSKRKGTKFC